MGDWLYLTKVCIYAFLFTLVISPFVIAMIKREKVGQVILNYVEEHSSKSGTPTMGGIIFVISISLVAYLCIGENSTLSKLAILIFVAYGLVGFLDDFIKFKFKRNQGLRAYQKIIFQLIIAVLMGVFVYKSDIVGSIVLIPFSKQSVDLGVWIIPLVALIYLATTNAVNLTDGLDGLASSTSLVYMLGFTVLLSLFLQTTFLGQDQIFVAEMKNLLVVSSVVVGAMLCFLIFNCFPAKIFMGDTGSLALGSMVSSLLIFSRLSFYIPFFGIMFVVSALSVILQVAYYKLSHKRIFLMAPLHHHFEKKGVHEVRITVCYALITFFVGAVTIILNIL